MKNNSELNEFIERLGGSMETATSMGYEVNKPVGELLKAARILHEIATNPDIKVVYKNGKSPELMKVMNEWNVTSKSFQKVLEKAPSALDDLIGGV